MDKADLSGTWRAALAGEELRRHAAETDFDDRGWERIEVPSHWRSTPAFAEADGPLLYRTSFTDEDLAEGTADADTRTWLVVEGVFYNSDVWFDGAYVGDTEGYFFPHEFDVSEAAAARRDHVLALEVGCAPQPDRIHKRNLTGIFQHGDLVDQDWNPGGIWRPVRIERTGPVRIRHIRVLCRDAREDAATVFVRAVLDTIEGHQVSLRTAVRDDSGRDVVELVSERHLAAGENRLEWTVTVPNPNLWWPWTLGDQPRYNIEVEVATEAGPSDVRTRSIGLRRVELRNWIFSINGERLFLKGANQGPTAMELSTVDASGFERDVRLAKDANLDFLRVHAHVSRPEFYDAADAHGLLLWQDLPLQWGYARGVRAEGRRQAREAVDLLAHHPSVFVWCGHNEPIAIDPTPDKIADVRQRRRLVARIAVGQFLPTWNKSVLDHSIASVLEKTDGSRPVVPHSGILPHPPQLDGTDSHWYFGWYQGDERDFPRLLRWWPRVARFVSEFGAQAVPDDAEFIEPEQWPDLDWDRAYRRHGLQKPFFDEHVAPERYATFEAWQHATQRYQAELIRHHVHALRLLKYRPAGGFAQFCLADSHPAVTASVLAHDRRPKLAYAALRDACAPVIVLAGRLPERLRAGDPLTIPVYAVSDARILFRDMVITLHLYWSCIGTTQHLERRWQGELPADHALRIGAVDTTIPMADGDLALRVELHDADGKEVSRYTDQAPVRT